MEILYPIPKSACLVLLAVRIDGGEECELEGTLPSCSQIPKCSSASFCIVVAAIHSAFAFSFRIQKFPATVFETNCSNVPFAQLELPNHIESPSFAPAESLLIARLSTGHPLHLALRLRFRRTRFVRLRQPLTPLPLHLHLFILTITPPVPLPKVGVALHGKALPAAIHHLLSHINVRGVSAARPPSRAPEQVVLLPLWNVDAWQYEIGARFVVGLAEGVLVLHLRGGRGAGAVEARLVKCCG